MDAPRVEKKQGILHRARLPLSGKGSLTPRHMRNPHRSAPVTVAVVALFLVGTTAMASTAFPSLTVGKNLKTSTIYLQGPVSNPGKNKAGKGLPVQVADDLQVDKNLTVNGNLVLGKNTWIQSPTAGSVVGIGSDLNVTGAVTATGLTVTSAVTAKHIHVTDSSLLDTIYLTGAIASADPASDVTVAGYLDVSSGLKFGGTLYSGSTNYSSRIDTNATLTTHINGFLACIGKASQFTTYIQSSDFITCFNSWLENQPVSVP